MLVYAHYDIDSSFNNGRAHTVLLVNPRPGGKEKFHAAFNRALNLMMKNNTWEDGENSDIYDLLRAWGWSFQVHTPKSIVS